MRRYYGWIVLLAVFLFQIVTSGVATYCFTLWVLPWMKEFSASRGEIMMASTASILLTGLLAPAVGAAMDRYPIRNTICAGAAVSALAFVLIANANQIWHVVALYGLLVGIGFSFAGPMAAMIVAARWFPDRRGLAIGLVSTGIGAGGIALPLIVGYLIATAGWREACLALAFLYLALIPVMWLVIRDTLPGQGDGHGAGMNTILPASDERSWRTSEILHDRGFPVTAVAIVPPTIAIYGIINNMGPLVDDHGLTPGQLSILLSVIGAANLIGKLIFGGLVDWIDARYLYWVAVAGLATAMAIVLDGAMEMMPMVVASALIGFSAGSFMPLMGAMIGNRFGSQSFGRAMGLLYPFLALSAIGPVLTGWMRDEFGSYDLVLWLFLAGIVPVALLMMAMPQRRILGHAGS